MTESELEEARRWVRLTRARQDAAQPVNGGDLSASGDMGLDHRVAVAVLEAVRQDLPWWDSADPEGRAPPANERPDVPPGASLVLRPSLLFKVNWAGAGLARPEAYYVVPVPELEARVVAASRDSDSVTGHHDLAIGWCPLQRDLAWGTKKVVLDWWRRLGQAEPGAWDTFVAEGLVNGERAGLWRRELWGRRQERE
jgi:hypothetical protein